MTNWIIDCVQAVLLYGFTAAALLWAFTPKTDPASTRRIIFCVVLAIPLQVGIDIGLSPYIHEGALAVEWLILVLLANRVAGLPLVNAIGAQLCLFPLMLGLFWVDALIPESAATTPIESMSEEERLLQEGLDGEMSSEEATEDGNTPEDVGAEDTSDETGEESDGGESADEEDTPEETPTETEGLPPILHQIEESLLMNRMGGVQLKVISLFDESNQPEPDPTPDPDATPGADPVPTAVPTQTPVPYPTPADGSISQEEFLYLFEPVSPEDLIPTPTPGPVAIPTVTPPTPTPLPTDVTIENPVDFVEEDLEDVVQLQNRSTDRRYAPPTFQIDAVGLGANGRYAIIDGRFVREGTIIRTSGSKVRGWKLIRIREKVLLWQPLL